MRTTVDLPADLHHVVSTVALHTRRSMNQTLADLIRRGLAVAPARPTASTDTGPALWISASTGLPEFRSPRPVTPEDVRALEDE